MTLHAPSQSQSPFLLGAEQPDFSPLPLRQLDSPRKEWTTFPSSTDPRSDGAARDEVYAPIFSLGTPLDLPTSPSLHSRDSTSGSDGLSPRGDRKAGAAGADSAWSIAGPSVSEAGPSPFVKPLPPLPIFASTSGSLPLSIPPSRTAASPHSAASSLPPIAMTTPPPIRPISLSPSSPIASRSARPDLPPLSIPLHMDSDIHGSPSALRLSGSPIGSGWVAVEPRASLKGEERERDSGSGRAVSRSDEGHVLSNRRSSLVGGMGEGTGLGLGMGDQARRASIAHPVDGLSMPELYARSPIASSSRAVFPHPPTSWQTQGRPPNPLGHTYGNSSSPTSNHQMFVTSKRRRRATFDEGSGVSQSIAQARMDYPLSADLRLSRRNSAEFGWKPGVGVVELTPDVLAQAMHERVQSGELPPGAYPASDPAALTAFELSASGQYAVLAGSRGPSSAPLGVVPIPRRTTSLKVKQDPADGATAYGSSPTSKYTVRAISILGTAKPLVSPAISSRQAEARQGGFFDSKPLTSLIDKFDHADIEAAVMDSSSESAAVIGTAPLASSLLLEAKTFSLALHEHNASLAAVQESAVRGPPSLPSMTDASSPTDTPEHTPMTSASNSLSRSTKSGKELDVLDPGQAEALDPEGQVGLASSIADPHGLAAKLAKRLRVADRRKCVLTELLETEVAYRGHLRDMEEVYSPSLTELSTISPEIQVIIMRNIGEILSLHEAFCSRMLVIAVEERLGGEAAPGDEQDDGARTERLIKRLAELFVEMAPDFAVYETYCSEAASAMDAIRSVEYRPEWIAFEKRCQAIVGTKLHLTLHQALAEGVPGFLVASLPPPTLTGVSSRLMFRDLLILPVQRVCRYPFMLGALSLVTATTPSVHKERPFDFHSRTASQVDRALGIMKDIAACADAANDRSLTALRSANIIDRLETHPDIEPGLTQGLGLCRLAGPMEVLYHHPVMAPIVSPVKVKYLIGFLYDGYLMLAKVKKATVYEIKHYMPLEIFELIDVTSGLLPHSIRLQLQQHCFEIALNCAKEKAVWSEALCAAREVEIAEPFSRPCSVIVSMNRVRRKSTMTMGGAEGLNGPTSPLKRNSFFGHSRQNSLTIDVSRLEPPDQDAFGSIPQSPSSPVYTSFMHDLPPTGAGASGQSLILRRPPPTYQAVVDSNISDICSESVLTARAAAMLETMNASPGRTVRPGGTLRNKLSMRDSSMMIRRRSSYADMRKSVPSSPEMGGAPTFSTLGRSGSSYGFGRRSADRQPLFKRNSSSDVEMLSASPMALVPPVMPGQHLRHLVSERPTLESIAGSSGQVSTVDSVRTARDRDATLRASRMNPASALSQSSSRLSTFSPSPRVISPKDQTEPPEPSLRHQASVPNNLGYGARPNSPRSHTLPVIPSTVRGPSRPQSMIAPDDGSITGNVLAAEPGMYALGAGITNTPSPSPGTPGIAGGVGSAGGAVGLTRSFSLRWLGGTLRRDRSSLSISDFGTGSSHSASSAAVPSDRPIPVLPGDMVFPPNNLTGQPDGGQSSASGSPSMSTEASSFGPSRRNSVVSEGDFLTFSVPAHDSGKPEREVQRDPDSTVTRRASSVFGSSTNVGDWRGSGHSRSRTTSSAGSSLSGGLGSGRSSDSVDKDKEEATVVGAGVAPLKRRKSAKFFSGLNRFTSINRGG